MHALFRTDPTNTALLIQRLVLAAVVFPHGAQKLFGWFGGYGYEGTMGFFTSQGVPAPLAFLVIMAETVGTLLLAIGLLSRIAAIGVACVMAGAIAIVHAKVGFFMNWTGQQGGEGFEYHLLALALAIPIAIWGAGRASVDATIAQRLERRRPTWREAAVPT